MSKPHTRARLRRVTGGPILSDTLCVGDLVVAHISCGQISPMHGYYPPHPISKAVKTWAARNKIPAPLYQTTR